MKKEITVPHGGWNYDMCLKEAQKYKSRSEFYNKNEAAYTQAWSHGWLDEYTWFTRPNKMTKERAIAIGLTCTSKTEFQRKSAAAYKFVKENNLFDELPCIQKVVREFKPRKWSRANCYVEAKKYKSRTALMNGNSNCYLMAYRHGWLDDYVWMTDQRGQWKKKLKDNSKV